MVASKERLENYNRDFADSLLSRYDQFRAFGVAKFVLRCLIHGRSELAWGCRHVKLEAVSDKPEGIVEVKLFSGEREIKVFLCKKCFKLFEDKRFNPEKEIITCCFSCVEAAVKFLCQRDPSLFVAEERR